MYKMLYVMIVFLIYLFIFKISLLNTKLISSWEKIVSLLENLFTHYIFIYIYTYL
jgi:hypothetical protein